MEDKNYGKQLDVFETKMTHITLIRVLAVLFLLAMTALGVLVLFDGGELQDFFIIIGSSVLVFLIILLTASLIQCKAIVFEEGVKIKNNLRKEIGFHFNEISGLLDSNVNVNAVVPTGDLISGLIVTALGGIINGVVETKKQSDEIRQIVIVPKNGGKRTGFINTGGYTLCRIYTEWIIKQQSITPENLCSLTLTFGDKLTFERGNIIYKCRNGDIRFAFSGSEMEITFGPILGIRGANKKDVITVNVMKVLNIDLLFYIHSISNLPK